MDVNETYKKIPWVLKVSNFFDKENLSLMRLDRLPEKEQKFLVYQSMLTLSQYFSMVPDHHSDSETATASNFELIKSLNNTLPTWLGGLCDLNVLQIISGLLDILNMKTEYQKWPPKSVMEFYSVCKKSKPAYHAPYVQKFKQIECEKSRKKSEEIARNHMEIMCKSLGVNYDFMLNKRKLKEGKNSST
jgi:hypothetical protein